MKKVGVVGIIPRGKSVLVLRRSPSDSFLPGQYDLPGGGLELGETPEDGIRREVLEETGLRAVVVRSLGTRGYVLSNSGKKDKALVVFLLRTTTRRVRLSKEHDEYRWVSESSLREVFGKRDLMGVILSDYFSSGYHQ